MTEDDDLITIVEQEATSDDEFFSRFTPLIGIARDNSDGSLMFETTMNSPQQVLYVLKRIEDKVLEDCFGERP